MKRGNENRERAAKLKDMQNQKRENMIDSMSPDEVADELKQKKLPTFGTNKERVDRLKQHYGIKISSGQPDLQRKNSVLKNIGEIEKNREVRRKNAEESKSNKNQRIRKNEKAGKMGDVDFMRMIEDFRSRLPTQITHVNPSEFKISVCVRKRPIFAKEEARGEQDVTTCIGNKAMVHEPKFKVDGITKYLQNMEFTYDNTFGEKEDGETVYQYSLKPMCEFVVHRRGTVTCFAYGQTGSGKTFTMMALQRMAISDLFKLSQAQFVVSFFEIYGGRCHDLFNKRARLNILEDGNQNIIISGLTEQEVSSEEELVSMIDYGNSVRTTHCTVSNQDSSRSHAICRIKLMQNGQFAGCLNLVDLAGSERASDTLSDNRQRRLEGAEINKSLLALKECIRALCAGGNQHIPYRGSKLTLVLRDAFVGKKDQKKIVMITCINPGNSSAEHTINSLRYSDRLKEQSGLNNKVQVAMPARKQQAPAAPSEQRNSPKAAAAAKPSIPKQQPAAPAKAPAPAQPPTAPAKAPIPKKNPVPAPARPPVPERIERNPAAEINRVPVRNNVPGDSSSSEDERVVEEVEVMEDKHLRATIDDIKYMHTTNQNQDENMGEDMLNFHEKVELIMEEEEKLLSCHVDVIKEDARMLTEEGRLISQVQGEGVVDYDIDEYVKQMEKLVKHKVQIYSQLARRLNNFKKYLNEEEQVSHNLTRNANQF